MLRRPETQEVMELGKTLGLNLTPTEARIMQSRMDEQLTSAEEFEELRIEEQRLPLKFTNRDPGYRPTEEEDPLNAFIRKCRVVGADDGPLKGKTIGMKDQISVSGIPLTLGCRLMEGYTPDFDATIVTRVLDAGGTIVGKLNMASFSLGGPGLSGVGDFGRPLNPHIQSRVTGESSSGPGVAVAGGFVDVAFGGDQGGSIRLPASWCGTVGMKATHGLIPHTGVFGIDPAIDHVGPLTRTVEDMAVVLECVAGPDGYDTRQINVPNQLFKYVDNLTRGVDGLRIGILSEAINFERNEPDVRDAVLEAVAVLERAGARVTKVSVPLHNKGLLAIFPLYAIGLKRAFDTNLAGAFAEGHYPTSLITTFGRYKRSHGHEFGANFKLMLLVGTYLDTFYQGRLYAKAHNARRSFIKQYDEALAQVDILAMPTVPTKAPAYVEPKNYIEATERSVFGGQLGINAELIARNTAPFNFTGHPAITIPCAKSEGLPIGLQLVAAHFREDFLLQAAYAYEHSVDWPALFPTGVQPFGRDNR